MEGEQMKTTQEVTIEILAKKVRDLEAQNAQLKASNKELRDWRHAVRKAVGPCDSHKTHNHAATPQFDLSRLFQ